MEFLEGIINIYVSDIVFTHFIYHLIVLGIIILDALNAFNLILWYPIAGIPFNEEKT